MSICYNDLYYYEKKDEDLKFYVVNVYYVIKLRIYVLYIYNNLFNNDDKDIYFSDLLRKYRELYINDFFIYFIWL